jgi:hypothetical protein
VSEIVSDNRAAVEKALAIARAATEAHRRSGCADEVGMLLGTVAALALHGQATAHEPASYVEELSGAGLRAWLKDFWAAAWIVRPDLVSATGPLTTWLQVPGRSGRTLARGARLAATAAIEAGLFEFVERHRRDADLLGAVMTEARPSAVRSERRIFHSPGGVAALAALAGADGAKMRFSEDACGTGQLARAAADSLRAAGRDPAGLCWYLNDADPLSAACTAANAWLWDLGPNVLIGSADISRDPAWEHAAAAAAAGAIRERDEMIHVSGKAASILAAVALHGDAPAPSRHRVSGRPLTAEGARCGACAHVHVRQTTRGWRSNCALSPTARRGPDVPADLPACAAFAARPQECADPYTMLRAGAPRLLAG